MTLRRGARGSGAQAQEAYGALRIDWLEQDAARVTPPAEPLVRAATTARVLS